MKFCDWSGSKSLKYSLFCFKTLLWVLLLKNEILIPTFSFVHWFCMIFFCYFFRLEDGSLLMTGSFLIYGFFRPYNSLNIILRSEWFFLKSECFLSVFYYSLGFALGVKQGSLSACLSLWVKLRFIFIFLIKYYIKFNNQTFTYKVNYSDQKSQNTNHHDVTVTPTFCFLFGYYDFFFPLFNILFSFLNMLESFINLLTIFKS